MKELGIAIKGVLPMCCAWLMVALFIALVRFLFPNPKPDMFQCPHFGTTLKWSDGLCRGYIECRSGWTAKTNACDWKVEVERTE